MLSTRNSKLETRNFPILTARAVHLSFGGLMAVNNFSLQLTAGELHGLIGPNGAGKTTIFNLLTGFYRPAEGDITFNGGSLVGLPPEVIARRGIARTFQNIRLFQELSVLDNVIIPFQNRTKINFWQAVLRSSRFRQEEKHFREQAWDLLEKLDLQDQAGEMAGRLPYGQQRRLEIARALAVGPQLLLLDEPAAGLNPQESESLMVLLQDLKRYFKLTILLIEHNMKFVMHLCQALTVLNHGLVIAQGAPALIRSDPQVIQAYLGESADA